MSADPSTRALHAGSSRAPGASSSPPILMGTTLLSAGDVAELPAQYTRLGNPTWEALEEALGAWEDARATVFASGQAASFALMMALTEDRSRLLLQEDGYYGTRVLVDRLAKRGLEPVRLDFSDFAAVERELARGPALVWSESPTNPLLRVQDLTRLAGLCAAAGASLVVDNTTVTAALQKPLDLGAVASVVSLTKASSGHSDVLLGAVTTREQGLLEHLRGWRSSAGAIPGPIEAWLALRGLRTLPLRIERQSANAQAIADFLGGHARVRRVHYPGLDPATRELARRQMPAGFGPLLSFELDGDAAATERVIRAAQLVRPSTSFGGVESSWERRARWPAESAAESLIRLSAGIERIEDLLADLEQALS